MFSEPTRSSSFEHQNQNWVIFEARQTSRPGKLGRAMGFVEAAPPEFDQTKDREMAADNAWTRQHVRIQPTNNLDIWYLLAI